MISEFLFNGLFIFLQRVIGAATSDAILLEIGDYLLQENNDRILLE